MLLVDDDRFCGVTGLRGDEFPESRNSCFPNQGSQIGTTEITQREITISSKNKDTEIFEKHLNSVMLVFIRQLSLSQMSTNVPGFQSFFRFFQSFDIG